MNDYSKGYKDALKDVLEHLRLIGGPEMDLLINSIRYATTKGVDFDYTIEEDRLP